MSMRQDDATVISFGAQRELRDLMRGVLAAEDQLYASDAMFVNDGLPLSLMIAAAETALRTITLLYMRAQQVDDERGSIFKQIERSTYLTARYLASLVRIREAHHAATA